MPLSLSFILCDFLTIIGSYHLLLELLNIPHFSSLSSLPQLAIFKEKLFCSQDVFQSPWNESLIDDVCPDFP